MYTVPLACVNLFFPLVDGHPMSATVTQFVAPCII
jgi:hypothetical protein